MYIYTYINIYISYIYVYLDIIKNDETDGFLMLRFLEQGVLLCFICSVCGAIVGRWFR